MSLPRSVSLAALVIVGSAWAAILVELALWLMIDGPRSLTVPLRLRLLGGLSAVCAGLVIFMLIVADRLFPGVGRRGSMWKVEMATMLTFLGCGAACLLSLAWGI